MFAKLWHLTSKLIAYLNSSWRKVWSYSCLMCDLIHSLSPFGSFGQILCNISTKWALKSLFTSHTAYDFIHPLSALATHCFNHSSVYPFRQWNIFQGVDLVTVNSPSHLIWNQIVVHFITLNKQICQSSNLLILLHLGNINNSSLWLFQFY